ncbi:MAG: methionyl-tRNA formyltransferase [Clostridiales bacterium]|uniref:methionyl-tRNA formyltransferase n=1 Tax=Clostridium sp. N3C TaxID=1776758 RepID=UPI00092E070C|nr:methionyl-tRNA formyltransferase [Clostridium sp. N3C]NLZ49811.1 methionyl-tRNA formyltransferase [Clostridiales bacterium]SCN22025.1 Methionyl-tRNA formyltransferase [Clostridium sp. N3C]
MKIVFMGTPEFAVPTLKACIENFDVTAVFTQPDKPKGRGKKVGYSEVKEEALKHNIEIFQPIKLKEDKETIEKLKEMAPDFIIVVAYGQILPKEVLDIPKCGCINLHASLLPKYRGAAPINWCIINGDKYSGNTTMLMDVGLDTGDILLQSKVEITDTMTAGQLHDILMVDGAELMVKTIKAMSNNEITPIKQKDSESCYASMLNKEMAHIQWEKRAADIVNLVRGLNPWPVAFSKYQDKAMKIFAAEVKGVNKDEKPGTIVKVSKEGILVAALDNYVLIKEVQFPNGKRMSVESFLNGNSIEEGIILE